MTNTLMSLTIYIAWTLSIVVFLGVFRSYLTLSGQKAPNKFSPSGDDVSAFSGRICRAHANCYEFFPIAGGLLLAALATGNLAITEEYALYLAYARILQSVVHILSTSVIAVYARFTFFLIQIIICVIWLLDFCKLSA